MMSRTHIAVGAAAALAVVQPHTLGGVLAAVVSGAVGGMVCDVDTRHSASGRDARRGGLALAALVAALLAVDCCWSAGLVERLVSGFDPTRLAGAAAVAALLVWGVLSKHRTFTHSLLGLVLFGTAVHAACPPLAPGFAAGMASHIALDLLNRMPVALFYPIGRGVCLGLYRANGIANNLFFALACIAAVALALTALL